MKSDKDLYRSLRILDCDQLWKIEIPRYDRAPPSERVERVALIRAVGVVFSEKGTPAQKAMARGWVSGLLHDPSEKVRRYAIAALPKLGSGTAEEEMLLGILAQTDSNREKKFVGKALDKVGGAATLTAVTKSTGILPQTELKVRASIARREQPSSIRFNARIDNFKHMRIHLHCRKGLEEILHQEIEEQLAKNPCIRIIEVRSRCVALEPLMSFSLSDLYVFRCFAHIGFVLGIVKKQDTGMVADDIATVITSPLSRSLLTMLTEGSLRYRLEFISKGHQRGTIHRVANRAFELCADLLNDARSAPWSMDVHPAAQGYSVELRPRLSPDPRWYYRTDDVPAASHPPLAASMARLAGKMDSEIVWDPFCGSGLEIIERALLGGVTRLFGTDVSQEALVIAQANLAAAKVPGVESHFACCDFRDFANVPGLGPERVTLMITNPPMGRRVRIKNMRGLIESIFDVAAIVLKPGGRLVFANPLRMGPRSPNMKLNYQKVIDLGGFDCCLELYVKK